MLLESLEKLLDESSLEKFQIDLNENISDENLFKTFQNGDTLFHRLIQKDLSQEATIKFIYKLSDAGLDINLQNNIKQQTCLHLAIIKGLPEVVHCLLINGADLTITDNLGLCAYNYARRIEDKELSKKIISKMQFFYPTYWVGVDKMDMSIIRRLVNSWCRFKVKKNGRHLIEYTKEKGFKQAYELFVSLDTQMDLSFAVMACNVSKVQSIIENKSENLKINFRNMKDHNASIFYYAIKQNDPNLLKTILKAKPYILNEYISDDLDIDYPVFFAALECKIDESCIKLLTPELNELNANQIDISLLFYKGKSFLRYSIEMGVSLKTLENLLNSKYCSRELVTVKDPDYLTSKEYALQNKKYKYVDLIDRVIVDYIINNEKFRMQLALNGFDFIRNNLKHGEIDLLTYAKENNLTELSLFLENVQFYQEKIDSFHLSVEKNDYYAVKSNFMCEFEREELNKIFYTNILMSKRRNESQTVFYKAVLNGYYEILSLLLDLMVENPTKIFIKLDFMRDHCYRTPMHYACGYNDNKKTSQLLSQYGFSDNVFDKDGMTPLDFQERINSEELQDLIKQHKLKDFVCQEPNPWSWQVWTRIQREKDTLKQLISVSHPHLKFNHSHSHGHSHGHSHEPSSPIQIQEPNSNCKIL